MERKICQQQLSTSYNTIDENVRPGQIVRLLAIVDCGLLLSICPGTVCNRFHHNIWCSVVLGKRSSLFTQTIPVFCFFIIVRPVSCLHHHCYAATVQRVPNKTSTKLRRSHEGIVTILKLVVFAIADTWNKIFDNRATTFSLSYRNSELKCTTSPKYQWSAADTSYNRPLIIPAEENSFWLGL